MQPEKHGDKSALAKASAWASHQVRHEKAVKKLDSKSFAAKHLPCNEDPDSEAWLIHSIQD
jgi:hypothetical protein